MKYAELVRAVQEYEKETRLGDEIYFSALEGLRHVRTDASAFTYYDLMQVVRVFLLEWGGMARAVNQKDAQWWLLADSIRRNAGTLNGFSRSSLFGFCRTNQDAGMARLYDELSVKRFGSTAVSKVLHLFNPDLYMMWDDRVRKMLGLNGSSGSYVDFLYWTEAELAEAIAESGVRRGQLVNRIARDIAAEPRVKLSCRNKTLVKLADEYWLWLASGH